MSIINYECSFLLASDNTLPTIAGCTSDIVQTIAEGTSSVQVTWTEPTASDAAGGLVMEESTASPGAVFSIGVTPVTYTFTDSSGNFAQCTFNVVVCEYDSNKPLFTFFIPKEPEKKCQHGYEYIQNANNFMVV